MDYDALDDLMDRIHEIQRNIEDGAYCKASFFLGLICERIIAAKDKILDECETEKAKDE